MNCIYKTTFFIYYVNIKISTREIEHINTNKMKNAQDQRLKPDFPLTKNGFTY